MEVAWRAFEPLFPNALIRFADVYLIYFIYGVREYTLSSV